MRTLTLLYPGCIPFEVMLAAELVGEHWPVTVATPNGRDVRAANGMTYKAETSWKAAGGADYGCVLIPGGDPYDVLEHPHLESLLTAAHSAGAWLGAICAGPLLLAKAGLLRGRRFTHGYGDHHRETLAPYWEGADFVDEAVVIDGRVVTAQAWAHVAFGTTLLRALWLADAARADRLTAYYQGRPEGGTQK